MLSAPAEADGRFNIRLFGSSLTSGGDALAEPDPITGAACLTPGSCATMDAQDGSGGGLSVEFRVTKHRVGIELGALTSEVDIALDFVQSSPSPGPFPFDFTSTPVPLQTDFTPIFLGANYHVMKPESKVDFYVGLLYADVSYGTERTTLGSQPVIFDFEDDSGWGFNMAFDVYLSNRWYVGGGQKFLIYSSPFT